MFAVHPCKAGDDVRGGVSFRVPDVQSIAAWVREHVQDVSLFAVFFGVSIAGRGVRRKRIGSSEGALLSPISLPSSFNFSGLYLGIRDSQRQEAREETEPRDFRAQSAAPEG